MSSTFLQTGETISITRALAELKLLDKRIESKIESSTFVAAVSKKNKHLVNPDTFTSSSKSELQSIEDLLKRRNTIKSAIIASNSVTRVRIGKEDLTVADVIERKNSLHLYKRLLTKLKTNREQTMRSVELSNQQIEPELQKILEIHFGKSNSNMKTSNDDIENISKTFRENNRTAYVDPIGIDTKIKDLESRVDDFERESNFLLSESNAMTKITV